MMRIPQILKRLRGSSLGMNRSAATAQALVMCALCGALAGCQTTAGGTRSTADSVVSRGEAVAGRCDFLPESQRPAWVTTRPNTDDYIGVGQAGTNESPEMQIRAAEDSARGSLASEVKVKIQEQLTQNLCEGQCGADEQIIIHQKTESKTKQTLKGAKIQHRWLDRGSCMVWVLVTLPRDKVELRRGMMFNQSPPSIEMAGFLLGHLERVLREDLAVVPADAKFAGCVLDSASPECQDRGRTIYGTLAVALEREAVSSDGQFRQRNFRAKGGLWLQDRQVSSFDVTCKGRAEARADAQTLDRAAAEACRDKVKQTLRQDLEMMD